MLHFENIVFEFSIRTQHITLNDIIYTTCLKFILNMALNYSWKNANSLQFEQRYLFLSNASNHHEITTFKIYRPKRKCHRNIARCYSSYSTLSTQTRSNKGIWYYNWSRIRYIRISLYNPQMLNRNTQNANSKERAVENTLIHGSDRKCNRGARKTNNKIFIVFILTFWIIGD